MSRRRFEKDKHQQGRKIKLKKKIEDDIEFFCSNRKFSFVKLFRCLLISISKVWSDRTQIGLIRLILATRSSGRVLLERFISASINFMVRTTL